MHSASDHGETEIASWEDANLDIRFPGVYECQDQWAGYLWDEEEEDEREPVQCEECGWELPNCCCVRFADPGGNSALRAASEDNPRNLPCPTCGAPNRLTPEDRRLGYQCDACADALERGGP